MLYTCIAAIEQSQSDAIDTFYRVVNSPTHTFTISYNERVAALQLPVVTVEKRASIHINTRFLSFPLRLSLSFVPKFYVLMSIYHHGSDRTHLQNKTGNTLVSLFRVFGALLFQLKMSVR